MQVKLLEIRDRMTCIPVYAFKTQATGPEQEFLLRRVGFTGGTEVVMGWLIGERTSTADPYHWGDRTLTTAHNHIRDHWATLKDGDVVDVEFILGETTEPKISERLTRHEY